MIRACNHSSFPKFSDTPMDDELRRIFGPEADGSASRAEVEEKIGEVTTVVVAQQGRAFIDIVTDGRVRWNGPLSYMAEGIDGLETGEPARVLQTELRDAQLVIRGPLVRKHSRFVDDYNAAHDVALSVPVKPALPGPVWLARASKDEHYRDLDAAADAYSKILSEEAAALQAAGATFLQIDEPLLCSEPGDFARIVRCVEPIFAAMGPGATTILSTYFGNLTALGEQVAELPGTHLGIDLTEGDENFAVLDRLPAGRGLYLGMLDSRSGEMEDGSALVARLEPYRKQLMSRDVLIGPNAGMEALEQDQAFDKLLHARYAVEEITKSWNWKS